MFFFFFFFVFVNAYSWLTNNNCCNSSSDNHNDIIVNKISEGTYIDPTYMDDNVGLYCANSAAAASENDDNYGNNMKK